MMTTNPTGKPVKKTPVKKVPTKKVPAPKQQTISPLIPGYGLTRKPGYETMSGKKGLSIKKAQKGEKIKKLPEGASSASAEKDYTKSDSIMNVIKNIRKKPFTAESLKSTYNDEKKIRSLFKSADSLKAEGDRKTKATGGVRRGIRFKNGGSLSGLTASTKRDKGVDPKGAFTKVQKKTLAGAKGKASLTKDKQLGATKMKMGGRMKKC